MENKIELNAANYKFVAIINKELENSGIAMNVIAHLSAGIVGCAPEELKEKMSFIDFKDKDNGIHPSVSALSLIVLRARSAEIAKIKQEAISESIHFVDFLETMTGNTYKEQLERTSNLSSDELKFYGIILFAEKEILNPLTRKFSLWK